MEPAARGIPRRQLRPPQDAAMAWLGVFEKLRALLIERCDDLSGVDW